MFHCDEKTKTRREAEAEFPFKFQILHFTEAIILAYR